MQERFALLLCLVVPLMRFVGLLISVMRLHKRGWLGEVSAKCFRWAEKSAAQGERDGFYHLGHCDQHGFACADDVERAKENFLLAPELGDVNGMFYLGELFDKHDPQRFVWFGRAAANGKSAFFLNETSNQLRNFISGTGNAKVIFIIGRTLRETLTTRSEQFLGKITRLTLTLFSQSKRFIFTNFNCNHIEEQCTCGQLLDRETEL
jgi:TPR repeat protein